MGSRSPPDGQNKLADRDLEVLAFAAEHHFITRPHVKALLGVHWDTAARRLRALEAAGYVHHAIPFRAGTGAHRITPTGLARIGSDLKAPSIDTKYYEHTVGLAWLWLAAAAGKFGPLQEQISERRMRSHDARGDGRSAPIAVRLGGIGAGGRPRLHYPDMVIVDGRGRRVAIELELSGKGRTGRAQILRGYGADPRYDAVLYLVATPSIGRDIVASARKAGIEHLVHVRNVRVTYPVPTRELRQSRVPARSDVRASAADVSEASR